MKLNEQQRSLINSQLPAFTYEGKGREKKENMNEQMKEVLAFLLSLRRYLKFFFAMHVCNTNGDIDTFQ